MIGLIGLILLITAWIFYRQPMRFLVINALSCVFLMADAFNHGATYLVLANLIILMIAMYQIGQKQKRKI